MFREVKVEEVAVANYVDRKYYDWHGKPDIEEYIQGVPEGEFTVQTYCKEALLDRHGSLQLIRWERTGRRCAGHTRATLQCCAVEAAFFRTKPFWLVAFFVDREGTPAWL